MRFHHCYHSIADIALTWGVTAVAFAAAIVTLVVAVRMLRER